MSVDNTSNYPSGQTSGNTSTGSGDKSSGGADWSALTEAFQNAFRTSLTGSGTNQKTDALLKTTDTPEAPTRLEQNRDDRKQTEATRQDGSRDSRQSQNRSDVRQTEMDREYQDANDRRDLTQHADDRRTQRYETPTTSETIIPPFEKGLGRQFGHESGSDAAFPPSFFERPTISVASTNIIPATGTGNSTNIATNTPPPISTVFVPVVEMAAVTNVTGMLMPPISQNVAQPTATPLSVSLQAATSVFTVFTASGKLGDEKKKEEEERRAETVWKKKEKKGTAFFGEAVLRALGGGDGSISVRKKGAATEPEELSRWTSVENNETEEKPTAEETETKSKETDPNRRDPAFDELLRRMQAVNEPAELQKTNESEPTPSPQEERVLFVQRIAAACTSAAQRTGIVRIKLSLDDEESLTLRMSARKTSDGKRELSVHFETESEATADLLRNHLDELRDTLAERGVILCQVEIET